MGAAIGMNERRMPFSGPMIEALLDWRKDETRRVIKPRPVPIDEETCLWSPRPGIEEPSPFSLSSDEYPRNGTDFMPSITKFSRYGQPGDRLLATETWRIYAFWKEEQRFRILYKADGSRSDWITIPEPERFWRLMRAYDKAHTRWRPARFMPREFSRILLELAELEAQWLQNIRCGGYMVESDVQREGCPFETDWQTFGDRELAWFVALWDSINPEYPWASNPLVLRHRLRVLEVKR